ncbi:MAG: helix-turn-helix domain-containing protein [Deltaproteobacteria bacterium]|nr:helix-turn-helix domain-containing protein [Deltaproteobacteria bacterium]
MLGSKDSMYAALKAKDARFDGRFFVAVSSTGIYCRPVCRARLPKPENCSFYETAAEAEQAGYRPCLVCRPEMAPGLSKADASAGLAERAARALEETLCIDESLEAVAARLGCTGRHLRRAFADAYHVQPAQYLLTCRLLLAKSLLTDTRLPVLEVAMASGFGSLRRFNAVFKERYRLTPSDMRKGGGQRNAGREGGITLALGYRPPYRWEEMLGFLGRRAIAGVETVKDGAYFRTVRLTPPEQPEIRGWLRVGDDPDGCAVTVATSGNLLPVLPQVIARVKRMFDLGCDPHSVYETVSSMNDIRPGLCVPGTRLPGCFDPFETAVRAVLGQQITVKSAGTLAARVVAEFGSPVQTGIDGLTSVFPAPREISGLGGSIRDRFGALGVISSRSRTIGELALAFSRQEGDCFGSRPEPEGKIRELTGIRGIGSWTAQYIAMRSMDYTDAFLETDAGVKKALPQYSPKELLRIAERWRPWRSYAVISLWNSLSGELR